MKVDRYGEDSINLVKNIKGILGKKKSVDDQRREFVKIYDQMFHDSDKRTKKEVDLINHSFRNRLQYFDENKIHVTEIVSDELRDKRLKDRKEHEEKYGKFRMPDVRLPDIQHQSLPEIDESKRVKIPFKLRVVKLWGEDKAFFRYKNKKLFEQKINRAQQMMVLPDISKK